MSHVFDLVKSLSKGEKKIIRVKAEQNKKGDSSAYLTLFDIYTSMERYDKDEFKRKVDEAGIKQIAILKMRLQEFILSSIRPAYASRRKVYEVRELVDYADILIEKGLFGLSRKMLSKAQKIGEKYDLLRELIVINEKLKTIDVLTNDLDSMQENIDTRNPETINLLQQIQAIQEYDNLIYETRYNMIRSFMFGMEYDKEQTIKIRQQNNRLNVILHNSDPVIDIKKNEIWSFIHLAEGNMEASINYRREVLRLLQEKKYKIEDNPNDWLYHSKMLIATLSLDEQYDEIEKATEEFESIIDSLQFHRANKSLILNVQSTIYMIRLNDLILNEKWKEGAAILPEVHETFKHSFNQLDYNNQQVLTYNIMSIYLGNKEYRTALRYLNQLINTDYKNTRVDIQVYARLVNLVIHYELGNYDLIEYLCESTLRFIKGVKKVTPFEKLFLQYAKKHLAFGADKKVFLELGHKINQLEDRSFEGFFNFEKWAERKAMV